MSDQPNKQDSIYNIDEETDSSFEQLFRDDGSQTGYSSESDSEEYISKQSISFTLQEISYNVQHDQLGDYVNSWMDVSKKLILKKPKAVRNAFNKDGPLGLFRLFLTSSFTNAVLEWTNTDLLNKAKVKYQLNSSTHILD